MMDLRQDLERTPYEDNIKMHPSREVRKKGQIYGK